MIKLSKGEDGDDSEDEPFQTLAYGKSVVMWHHLDNKKLLEQGQKIGKGSFHSIYMLRGLCHCLADLTPATVPMCCGIDYEENAYGQFLFEVSSLLDKDVIKAEAILHGGSMNRNLALKAINLFAQKQDLFEATLIYSPNTSRASPYAIWIHRKKVDP
jgi:hypothetical protein